MIQVEVFTTSNRKIGDIAVDDNAKVKYIKKQIETISPKLSVARQSLRAELKGKDIKDELAVPALSSSRKVYVEDLGPRIGWRTVFILEYAGPFVLYGLVALRPWILYGDAGKETSLSTTATIALTCWSIHYFKRVLETLFVHRFSHDTMPLRNLFRNCGYYYGFTLFIAYHTNDPLFTPPSLIMQIVGLTLFIVSELGNLSIHILLRNLRPPGTKVRKMPVPDNNPLTKLYNLVSCPNYTYEFGAWLGFTLLTSCVPAGIFALTGLYQMSIWALSNHKTYKKEFPDYPKYRKAILPFVL